MELNIDFFHIDNKNVAEKGKVLISEPFLSDHYFRRSLVYLCDYTEEGAMGFVLNKPLDIKVSDVLDDFPDSDFPVSMGGPVSNNTLHYMHTLGERIPESVPVSDGISWGGDFDLIKDLVAGGQVKAHELRFFMGYAGWSPDQLEDEMEEHAWLVGKLHPRRIMTYTDTDFWTNTLKNYRNKYRAWANFPEDPVLN